MVDRFIGNGVINSPYPATGLPFWLHGRGAERLDRRATAVRATGAYPRKLLQTGDSQTEARNGMLEPGAVSGPQYGTLGAFRSLGATGTRWSALQAWERSAVPGAADPEGKRRA